MGCRAMKPLLCPKCSEPTERRVMLMDCCVGATPGDSGIRADLCRTCWKAGIEETAEKLKRIKG